MTLLQQTIFNQLNIMKPYLDIIGVYYTSLSKFYEKSM